MNSFALKIIAVVFMIVDHMAQFLPGMPIWMHWLGRLAAPIFIYCCVWSFTFTTNRKKYLLRLYIASIIMSFIQWKLNIPNNFFRSLFGLIIILYLLECFQNENNFGNKIVIYIIWQVTTILLCIVLLSYMLLPESFIAYVFTAITGSVFYLEGGLIYVLLGVLFWAFKNQKKKIVVSFCIFDIILFCLTTTSIISLALGWIRFHCSALTIPVEIVGYLMDTVIGLPAVELGGSMWWNNYEWMMIASLPFLLLYNKNKGKSLKWFFYIIYPLHIVILWYIGNSCL